jgi:hypothetical protein
VRDRYIQDECMAHEEDMLAFEYDSRWGGQDKDDDVLFRFLWGGWIDR